MTERAHELSAAADNQLDQLIKALNALDEAALARPCPGRDKLGDGTTGAAISHTADNYQRIAGFVETSNRMSTAHQRGSGHQIPKFLRALGHATTEHMPRQHADEHQHAYTAKVDIAEVLEQLEASRTKLSRLAELSDDQLDAIPPKDSFRFCDGQRTLDQVLTSLFKHQSHQIDAIKLAIA
jgi:hypothetical protein